MSYSFSVTGATKAQIKERATVEMAKVVASQPSHAKEGVEVIALCYAFANALKDLAPGKQYALTASGSLSGSWEGMNVTDISAVNVNIQAAVVDIVAK